MAARQQQKIVSTKTHQRTFKREKNDFILKKNCTKEKNSLESREYDTHKKKYDSSSNKRHDTYTRYCNGQNKHRRVVRILQIEQQKKIVNKTHI